MITEIQFWGELFLKKDEKWKFADDLQTFRPFKMKMSLFASLEQILRNWALHHLLTNGSSAVSGWHQNKSPKKKG